MANFDINTHLDNDDPDLLENKGFGGDQNSSQISNVDFGNLRKIGTNVSQVSALSNSTVKSNPLMKLFTRNRSQSNVTGRNPEAEFVTPSSSKNEFHNSDTTTKEAKITKLRAAKKILSPSSKSHFESSSESSMTDDGFSTRRSSDEFRGKKQILSSPSTGFHNLFHKSQSAAGLSKFGDKKSDERSYSGTSKTSICLSSNNSNSVVNDVTLARVYKFTNPNIQNEDIEGLTEHSSLLDIHRKMLTPADSYIQNKFNKHHSHEIGLGIVEKGGNGLLGVADDEELKLNKLSQLISSLLKPLFVPSKQKKSLSSSSSSSHPFLGYSLDEMGLIIKNHLCAEFNGTKSVEQNQKNGKHKLKSNKSSSKGQATGFVGSDSFSIALLDEDDSRGLMQDLSAIFIWCLGWLKRDVANSTQSSDHANGRRSFDFLDSWQTLLKSWSYYNRNIRFQILHIFQVVFAGPAFVEQKIPPICVDEILQHSFRTVFIIPLVEERKRSSKTLSSVVSISSHGSLNDQERHLFQQNPSLHADALHCLGSLQGLPQASYLKPDIEVQNVNHTMREIVVNLSDLS
ncbi:hypothetical protein I9W82_004388 [Candida metapsilosis]|uniref:Uncharacterized protein n=1 Tax=Candida metapsilosis TaxID=273372 RepID=A0A8H7ZCM2_9ASCO|nr:hypothetical protein I9W82_004388 [Candida metapsilosis]